MAVHVFWDNSNIWMGLKKVCEETERVPSTALRVHIRNLDDYVVRGRRTGKKFIAGSYPPECEELLIGARALGYDVSFFQRVDDGERIREQAVDMSLQLQMTLSLLDGNEKEVMAVLTGDSNIDPDSKTSFIEIIEKALCKRWTVEVYAARGTLSEQKYGALKERFGDSLQVDYLDSVYDSITFLVGGEFHFYNESELIHVNERIVSKRSWIE